MTREEHVITVKINPPCEVCGTKTGTDERPCHVIGTSFRCARHCAECSGMFIDLEALAE